MNSSGTPESDDVTTYDPTWFQILNQVEARHFWFQARNDVIQTLVRQVTAAWKSGYRVLEMGCGDGNVLSALEDACDDGRVIGMDLYSE